jgi:hypothetical protein
MTTSALIPDAEVSVAGHEAQAAKKCTAKDGPTLKAGGPDARRRAATVLEVLAGVVTPGEAAKALGVGLPRYYMIERQALEHLVAGCAPQPKGKTRSVEKEVDLLKRQVKHLEQDCARYQAIARTAQRTLGLFPREKEAKDKAGRKARRPSVRAMKIAATLKKEAAADVSITPVSG